MSSKEQVFIKVNSEHHPLSGLQGWSRYSTAQTMMNDHHSKRPIIHWAAQSDHDKWSCISLMCSIWTTLLACDNGVLGAHMLYSEDISYVTEICRKTTVWFFSWKWVGLASLDEVQLDWQHAFGWIHVYVTFCSSDQLFQKTKFSLSHCQAHMIVIVWSM